MQNLPPGPPYQYVPFKGTGNMAPEFRLAKVEPRTESGDDTLTCTLEAFGIFSAPSYIALSYTWGQAFDTNTDVVVNGDQDTEWVLVDGKWIQMGANLVNALNTLRDDGVTGFLWADAICIDQGNPEERGFQVTLMGEIYSRAERVIIWLGREEYQSDLAMNFLGDHLARLPAATDPATATQALVALANDVQYREAWVALVSLMSRRWWSRAWILQETILGRHADFVCGHKSLGRDELFVAFQVMVGNWDVLYNLLDSQYDIRLSVATANIVNGLSGLYLARRAGKPSNFLQVFYRTMSSVATNPRDYIFARLGMVSDSYLVTPSYTDPVEEIYTRFVLRHILATKTLEMVLFDARPRQYRALPSWVPDWSAHFCAMRLIDDRPHLEMDRCAAHDVVCNAQELLDAPGKGRLDIRKPLICAGYACDVVDGVSATGESTWAGASDYREASQPVFSSTTTSSSAYATHSDTYEAIWWSLTCHRFPPWEDPTPSDAGTSFALAMLKVDKELESIEQADVERQSSNSNNNNNNEPRLQTYYRNIRTFKINGLTLRDWFRKEASPPPPPITNFHLETNMVDSVHFRRLITTTRRGLIGLAPCETEPGDEVVMLLGSIWPVVLRKCGDRERERDGNREKGRDGKDKERERCGERDGERDGEEKEKYKVIGVAYVHGLMQGRGFEVLGGEGDGGGEGLREFALT